MSDVLDIESVLDDWLTDGFDQWPERSIDAVLATIDHTSQRRVLRVPWRTSAMTSMLRIAAIAGTAVIVALLAGGLYLVGGQRASVASPAPAPPSPSAPAVVPAASPALTPTPTTSAMSGPLGPAIVALDGTVRPQPAAPSTAWAPSLSADGTRIAYVDAGRLWIASAPSGTTPTDTGVTVVGRVGLFGEFPVDAAPAWSPDGTQIAYSSGGDIFVLAIGDPSPRQLTTSGTLDEWPVWSMDGRTIYYVNEGKTPLDDSAISPTQEVWRVSATGGTPHRVTRDDSSELQPDIGRDGSMVVWKDGAIVAMDPATGKTANVPSALDNPAVSISNGWNPRLSPDGKMLAYLIWNGGRVGDVVAMDPILTGLPLMSVNVVDLTTGQVTDVGPRVSAFWNPVSWTPDSSALLINRVDNGS